LFAKFSNLARIARKRLLNTMPVREALVLDDSLIFVLGGFPTGRARGANMKGSDVIGAHKRCRQ
jgi:hypothetical protein